MCYLICQRERVTGSRMFLAPDHHSNSHNKFSLFTLFFAITSLSLSLLFFLFSLFLFPQQYINVNTALLHNHLAFVQWIKQRHVSTGCYKETLWTTCWKFWKQTEGGKLKKKAFYSAEYLSVGWIFYNGNVFQLQCCVMKDQTCLCCYHISRTVHQFVSWGSEEAQCQFFVHCGHGTRWINSDQCSVQRRHGSADWS